MAKTYTKLNIEIDQPITDKIVAVQEDARSRYLDVQLYDDGMYVDLTGQKVRIYMIKPDGTHIMNDGEVKDPTSGRCQFALTTQTLAACGILETQIKVFTEEETEVLSTQVFRIFVTRTLLTNETIESTNEYGSLVILFQNVYEALVLMGEMVENFGKPGKVAAGIPVETFWGMLEELYTICKTALDNASIAGIHENVTNIMELIGTPFDTANMDTIFARLNLIPARIVLKGLAGTKFTINRTDEYMPEKVVTLTTQMEKIGAYYYTKIPVEQGSYKVNVEKDGGSTTGSVSVNAIGKDFILPYTLVVESRRFTSSGTYNVPTGVTEIFVTACGGGGGGGNGSDMLTGYISAGGGGGGGGGGAAIQKQRYTVTPGQTISITVGRGGTAGNAGTSTVIGSLITLAGGSAGFSTVDSKQEGKGGISGGSGGGAGGDGGEGNGTYFGSKGKNGTNGISPGGMAGTASVNTGGSVIGGGPGGGGGGSLGLGGNGGKGGDSPSIGTQTDGGNGSPGTQGGGGGGGGGAGATGSGEVYSGGTGGKGGDGICIIYIGTVIE